MQGGGDGGSLRCYRVLWGHESPLSAIVVDTALGVCVSGCRGGYVVVHALRSGEHIHTFPLLASASNDIAEENGKEVNEEEDKQGKASNHAADATIQKTSTTKTTSTPTTPCEVTVLALDGVSGDVAAHSWDGPGFPLSVFSVNGRCKASIKAPSRINAMSFSRTGVYLISGCEEGCITFRASATLEVRKTNLFFHQF